MKCLKLCIAFVLLIMQSAKLSANSPLEFSTLETVCEQVESSASVELQLDSGRSDGTIAAECSVAASKINGSWANVNESMSARAAAYQKQITGRTGQSYVVDGVKFDGRIGNTLVDAKGPGYANFVKNGEFRDWFRGQQSLLDQARNQLGAANGAPITWHVAEPQAVTAMQDLFQANGIQGITIVHTPVIP